ncbi:MAG: hypothetical protein HZC14_02260 [Candidatus Niyogibacteria bacterium]|nr:hypothetical protein [Candidatus Niyogibacteria bacterium]
MKVVKVEEAKRPKSFSWLLGLFSIKVSLGDMFIVHGGFKVDKIRNVAPIENDLGRKFKFGDWGSVEEMGFLKVLEVKCGEGKAVVEYTAVNCRTKRSLPSKARFEVPLRQLSKMKKK